MRPPLRILALGRLVDKKGFEVLLRAGSILRGRGMDFTLAIGGSGPAGRRLRALSARLGLREQVRFPGFIRRDGVSAFLLSGDVFVMPSIVDRRGNRDGIPNVVLEALLHRLPVVASDVCGISEVIANGDTGFLVPPGDAAAVAEAIVSAAADRRGSLAMAERGRDRVCRQFNLRDTCDRMSALFEKHAKQPGP
jgi:glycosyltransferase involved in cell wall biosynthesis